MWYNTKKNGINLNEFKMPKKPRCESESIAISLALDYETQKIGESLIIHADCFEWLPQIPEEVFYGVVTDPPYGVKEYDFDQLKKRDQGRGGIWRLPPAFDGSIRAPLPRFTALSLKDRNKLDEYFFTWGKLVIRVMRPGAHLFIASNSFLSQLVFASLIRSGFEFRGELIRLVQTLGLPPLLVPLLKTEQLCFPAILVQ